MDGLLHAFKGDCHAETQKVDSKLLHAAAKSVAQLKKELQGGLRKVKRFVARR